jgi:probable rRNA maturation factor
MKMLESFKFESRALQFEVLFNYDARMLSRSELKNLNRYLNHAVAVFGDFLSLSHPFKALNKGKQHKHFTLQLHLVGDTRMRNLNSEYRGKDKLTDVLSFPMYEDLRKLDSIDVWLPEMELGDVVICKSVTIKQCAEFGISFTEEFIHLLVHGFLHILGMDHEISAKEEKLMQKHEAILLERMSVQIKKGSS